MIATSTLTVFLSLASSVAASQGKSPVKVFILAGQSNMVGADSKVADVDRYAPFVGWAGAQ